MPPLHKILRRNQMRGWLPAHEVEMLYSEIESFTDYDHRIDNSNILVEDIARQLALTMDHR